MNQGIFITFEGGEGAGKSTIVELVAARLREQDYPVLVSREPGGVPSAEKIRHLLLDEAYEHMDGYTEVLLFAAARRQHLLEKVIPALNAGKVVLCDRYVDSSLVYQGFARGIGIEEVKKINLFAVQKWLPQRTILLDLRAEVGLARIEKNGRSENRLDKEDIGFHRRVRDGYQHLAAVEPERFYVINAEAQMEHVEIEVYKYITSLLKQKN